MIIALKPLAILGVQTSITAGDFSIDAPLTPRLRISKGASAAVGV